MAHDQIETPPLRLWPGVAIVAVQWLLRFAVPVVWPEAMMAGVMGGLLGLVLVILWWAFFSRAPRAERFGGALLIAAALFATSKLAHISLAKGAMGMLLPLLAAPVISLAFVLWAVFARRLTGQLRWASMAATVVLASGVWTLVRTGGITGNFDNDLMWRWTPSPEERLLARAPEEPSVVPPAAEPKAAIAPPVVTEAPAPSVLKALWPGFRGPERDGAVRGLRIATDWTAAPPQELWRRPIGPGWSSFAVNEKYLYTQEQRGEEEVVSCYSLATGKPVWQHKDTARFWESNAGPGPRGTPSYSNGRVYTLGATGIVNALDGLTGAVIWTRNGEADTGAKRPEWGISGSPLVTADAVIVAVSGKLVAYDMQTGKPRWVSSTGGASYSSPQLATIDGMAQILLVTATGLSGVSPNDGSLLWQHDWKGYPIVQPAVTADGNVLFSVNESSGTRRLAVARKNGEWTVQELWTSNGLKPYFNDFVIHNGHAYGFDGRLLSCIDLADGKRKWKGGRFGQGQLILLPDQDLLLVLSEEGELALVKAAPDQFTELARRPAIEGKTWNHPVLAGDTLLIRNGQEMAAFRLTKESR